MPSCFCISDPFCQASHPFRVPGQRALRSQGSSARSKNSTCGGREVPWPPGQVVRGPNPSPLHARPAPPGARVRGFLRLPREGAGWRRGLFVVVSLGPAPKGDADHAARGPASPPPPRPARRLFVSNIRVSPLAGLRGRGSGAILDAVQLPSPHPSPRSWPLRTRPLRPGPGPSPATPCPSPAPPGPRPAAVPRPPRRPGVRAAACAARSGPERGPAARLSEPSRCPGRRRRKRAGDETTGGSGKESAAAAGPRAPWERRAALPAAPGVRGAAPRNMTAPWAALALLWGSLCAGENGRGAGGAGRARGAGLGRRAVFTNKGRAAASSPRHLHQLAPPGAGTRGAPGAPLADVGGGTMLSVRRFAEATPRWGPGPGVPGSGFGLHGRREPREREIRVWEGGRAGRADLIRGWRGCGCSSGCGKGYASLGAARRSERGCCAQLGALCTPSHQSPVVSRARRASGTGSHLRGVQPPRGTALFWAPGRGGEGRWGAKENQQVPVPSGLGEARGGAG